MSNVLHWEVEESSLIAYDTAIVYRSDSESGTYTQIASQTIATNTYNDEEGDSSSWYKVRFYNSDTELYSAYSTALKANTYFGFCSVTDVRDLTNITTDDLTDTEIANLIEQATVQLNRDINVEVIRERVGYIDDLRSNDTNGSNTTFYVKNWQGRYIADTTDDGKVTIADIEVIYKDSDGTETEATISTITPDEGKFVMATAPTDNQEVYVTYNWAARSAYTPDPLINLACALLSAAYSYSKINIGMAIKTDFGNTKITRHMASYEHYLSRYNEMINKINASSGGSLSAFADSPYTV